MRRTRQPYRPESCKEMCGVVCGAENCQGLIRHRARWSDWDTHSKRSCVHNFIMESIEIERTTTTTTTTNGKISENLCENHVQMIYSNIYLFYRKHNLNFILHVSLLSRRRAKKNQLKKKIHGKRSPKPAQKKKRHKHQPEQEQMLAQCSI